MPPFSPHRSVLDNDTLPTSQSTDDLLDLHAIRPATTPGRRRAADRAGRRRFASAGVAEREGFDAEVGLALGAGLAPQDAVTSDESRPSRLFPAQSARPTHGTWPAAGRGAQRGLARPAAIFTLAASLPGRRASGRSAESFAVSGPSTPAGISTLAASFCTCQLRPVRWSVTERLPSTISSARPVSPTLPSLAGVSFRRFRFRREILCQQVFQVAAVVAEHEREFWAFEAEAAEVRIVAQEARQRPIAAGGRQGEHRLALGILHLDALHGDRREPAERGRLDRHRAAQIGGAPV